jgi:hypothetical protein
MHGQMRTGCVSAKIAETKIFKTLDDSCPVENQEKFINDDATRILVRVKE